MKEITLPPCPICGSDERVAYFCSHPDYTGCDGKCFPSFVVCHACKFELSYRVWISPSVNILRYVIAKLRDENTHLKNSIQWQHEQDKSLLDENKKEIAELEEWREEHGTTCSRGHTMQIVRPGKYQCLACEEIDVLNEQITLMKNCQNCQWYQERMACHNSELAHFKPCNIDINWRMRE